MSVFGQFSNGPIQFNDATGGIESRGTIDRPQPSVTQPTPTPAASPTGGGILADPGSSTPDSGDREIGDVRPGGFTELPGNGLPGRSGVINGLPMQGGGFTNLPTSFGGPSNGGSYGMGGAGVDGGGDSFGGPAFDDGGEVEDPTGGDYSDGTAGQGAGSSTLDPMAMIKSAAAFGRKKFGLPSNFTTGQSDGAKTMGFDDGGMIPDGAQGGDDQVTGGGNMPDPRQALKYLTGDGAVSPEIAGALERHIDPQGQMDPAERTLKAISGAPSPEAQFGMMQHYRTQFNGFSAGARAAIDKGQLGQAAQHATQAFDNVPTGHKVHFAPAGNGGIAVMARKIGGAPAQAKGFDDGGQVPRWNERDDVPESENVVDRRNDPQPSTLDNVRSSASAFMTNTKENVKRLAGTERGKPAPSKLASEGGYDDAPDEDLGAGGVSRVLLGYDDGGEVEEDQQGVIPDAPETQTMDETAPPDEGAPAQTAPAESQDAAPVVLNPAQFKKLMEAGYDKPVDDGWTGLLQSIMGNIGPSSAEAASLPTPGAQHPADAGVTSVPKTSKGDRQPVSPALQQQMDTPTPLSQVSNEQQRAKPEEDKQNKYEQIQQRAEKTAAQIFPWASQSEQRAQYVQQQMSHYTDSENKIDQTNANGRNAIAERREANKVLIADKNNQARADRQTASIGSKESIARQKALVDNMRDDKRNQVRLIGQRLIADPSIAKDPEKLASFMEQMSGRVGIHPQDLQGILQSGLLNGGQGGGQPQPQGTGGAGSKPQGANMSAAQPGETRPYTKNGVTKSYKFGTDGMWHLAQ